MPGVGMNTRSSYKQFASEAVVLGFETISVRE
jgi:hypothetical protein